MGESKRRKANTQGSFDDPKVRRSLFKLAFDNTMQVLSDPDREAVHSLRLATESFHQTVDRHAMRSAAIGNAECRSGCAACCHQRVSCLPFEIFIVAYHLLTKKTPKEIAALKRRLLEMPKLPLDPDARYGIPCPLLESNRCTVYGQRPSACRTMLSKSRAACDASLAAGGGIIPQIGDPVFLSALLQGGMDYAFIQKLDLSTHLVELGGALLMALEDFDAVLGSWIDGGDPFQACEVRRPEDPPHKEIVLQTAKTLNVT